jgi:hypothetical protein
MNSQDMRRLPLYVYVVLTNAYGAITSVIALLWLISGEQTVFMRAFVNLLPPLLVPGLIALPIGLLLRKWQPVFFVLSSVLVFFALYGAAFIPKSRPDMPANITVMTGFVEWIVHLNALLAGEVRPHASR